MTPIARSLAVALAPLLALGTAVSGCLGTASPQPAGASQAAGPVASTPQAVAPPAPAAAPPGVMTAGPSQAAGSNILWNGTFDAGETYRPWSLSFSSPNLGRGTVTDGQLCLKIDQAGTQTFDVALRQAVTLASGHRYQVRLRTHATAPTHIRVAVRHVGLPTIEYWTAPVAVAVDPQTFTGTFDGARDDDNVELLAEFGGALSGQTPLTVCLDDIELNDPRFDVPLERSDKRPIPVVRVNELGYLTARAKTATVVSASATPADWELVSATGRVSTHGKTRPFGEDRSSGERVHLIDFSSFTTAGKGWKLRVGSDESLPFDIGGDVYRKLKYDALSFFYLQRSGVDIKMPFAGQPAYERPAGHVGDKSVPCAPEAKCSYSLDVSGGWYDAGDHGKYLVNGGLATWALQNQYETLTKLGNTASDFADGKMGLPEAGNGKPDLLDEARFNLDFMLRMQVPAGQPLAGMAHHKIHDEKWTPIPTLPHQDTVKRYLRPVSTAATLNLAAVAAQGARLWRTLDPAFSARALAAAEVAFAAAKAHPAIRAEREVQGGGAYGDGELADEFYWAAAELFITTGKPQYQAELSQSPLHSPKPVPNNVGTIGWQNVAPLGKISLTVVPNNLGDAAIADLRQQLIGAADRFVATMDKRGYRTPLPSDSGYVWGSNGDILNTGIVLGMAYRFTKDDKYANGVIDVMNYILGRNPLVQSYVAGYGSRALRNPHHRVWAHQKDPRLPEAPAGAVSGGPNSMLQDPYIRKLGKSGCAPQTCYVDNIDSYSTNEVAINWNAALAWDVAFLDDIARAPAAAGKK